MPFDSWALKLGPTQAEISSNYRAGAVVQSQVSSPITSSSCKTKGSAVLIDYLLFRGLCI